MSDRPDKAQVDHWLERCPQDTLAREVRALREDLARSTAENLSLKDRWCAANRVNRRLEATVARVDALCDRNSGGLLAVETVRAALQPRGDR